MRRFEAITQSPDALANWYVELHIPHASQEEKARVKKHMLDYLAAPCEEAAQG